MVTVDTTATELSLPLGSFLSLKHLCLYHSFSCARSNGCETFIDLAFMFCDFVLFECDLWSSSSIFGNGDHPHPFRKL